MRFELSDYERGIIKPMLPNKPRSIPRVDDRRVLTASFRVCDQARHGAICRRAMSPRLVRTVSQQPVLIDFGRRITAAA